MSQAIAPPRPVPGPRGSGVRSRHPAAERILPSPWDLAAIYGPAREPGEDDEPATPAAAPTAPRPMSRRGVRQMSTGWRAEFCDRIGSVCGPTRDAIEAAHADRRELELAPTPEARRALARSWARPAGERLRGPGWSGTPGVQRTASCRYRAQTTIRAIKRSGPSRATPAEAEADLRRIRAEAATEGGGAA